MLRNLAPQQRSPRKMGNPIEGEEVTGVLRTEETMVTRATGDQKLTRNGSRSKMVAVVPRDPVMNRTPGTSTSRLCNHKSSSSSNSITNRPHHYHHQPRSQILQANSYTTSICYLASSITSMQHHSQHNSTTMVQPLYKLQDSQPNMCTITPWLLQMINIITNPQW